jgi:hypothetical protein
MVGRERLVTDAWNRTRRSSNGSGLGQLAGLHLHQMYSCGLRGGETQGVRIGDRGYVGIGLTANWTALDEKRKFATLEQGLWSATNTSVGTRNLALGLTRVGNTMSSGVF